MSSGKSFYQLTQEWEQAATTGSLLTQKHDPNALYSPSLPVRSVVTQQLSASLENFIGSRMYTVDEYYNKIHQNYYYLVTPDSCLGFSAAGYFMLSGAQATGSVLDTIVMVSGSVQGWHIFAEASATINQKANAGIYVHQGQL